MKNLEQLELHISALLEKFDRIKVESERIRAESSAANAEKSELVEENRKLRASLTKEENLRNEALKRIDALLRKVQEHDSVE
ncbi:MAG: cell division protein ZapB [Desulfovibrio sp.]|jgi:cell division protein ZapB|nr:cell division protein ZapB [Desulfovibrio sp.]